MGDQSCGDQLWLSIDCLSPSDAIAECSFAFICLLLLVVSTKRLLRKRAWQEAQSRRNRLVHLGIIGYLMLYLSSLTCAVVLYLRVRWLPDEPPLPRQQPLVMAFTFLMMMYVVAHDLMYIAVAYMYFKAVISFGGLEETHRLDDSQTDRRLRRAKIALYVLVTLYLLAYGSAGLVLLLSKQNILIVDYITGGATFICTIVISVLFGFFYRRAVRHLELSRNTKREQSMRAVLLVVSALVRAIVNFAFSQLQKLRRLQPPNCLEDAGPFTIYLALYGLISNILPVLVYLKMFEVWEEATTVMRTVEDDNHTASRLIE